MYKAVPFEDFLESDYLSRFGASSYSYELHPDWYAVLLGYVKFKGDAVFYHCLFGDDGELEFALPLIHRQRGCKRSIIPVSNYYTSIFEPLVKNLGAGKELECYKIVLRHVLGEFDWDELLFGPVDKNGRAYKALAYALEELHVEYKPYYWFDNFTLNIEDNSEEFLLRKISSKIKNTVKRRAKKVDARYSAEYRIISDGASLDDSLDDFHRVYCNSWKKPEGSPQFISEFCARAASRGWLRLGELRLNGDVVASQIWFVKSGVASIFKLAHDEAYRSDSVGTLLTYEMMRYMIVEDRVRKIDYLIGDDSYKREWGFELGERWGVMVINVKSLYGAILYLRHILFPRLFSLFKKAL